VAGVFYPNRPFGIGQSNESEEKSNFNAVRKFPTSENWPILSLPIVFRYPSDMDTSPQTIDLAGLPEQTVQQVLDLVREARAKLAMENRSQRPSVIGRFVHLGYSFPKEMIDEARKEAWKNFPRDFPDPKQT